MFWQTKIENYKIKHWSKFSICSYNFHKHPLKKREPFYKWYQPVSIKYLYRSACISLNEDNVFYHAGHKSTNFFFEKALNTEGQHNMSINKVKLQYAYLLFIDRGFLLNVSRTE